MKISIAYEFMPKHQTCHASVVMDHFGIGFETGQHTIAENLELPVSAGDVVLFTGASGSGKSSLLRAVAHELQKDVGNAVPENFVIDIASLKLGSEILVDSLGISVTESMRILAACGLGEAQLLLRTPAELSDGQRYRFRLALALSKKPKWILADEFTATLDRPLAKVIAGNIRKQAKRTNTGFLLATTHNDVAEELQPDLHVECRLDGRIDLIENTEGTSPVKKRIPAINIRADSGKVSGSAKVPNPTGRTSLGGITAATTRASSGS